jgi:Ni/Fe-hydrogenase subunit HybB-like protein
MLDDVGQASPILYVTIGLIMALLAIIVCWLLSGKKLPGWRTRVIFWWLFLPVLWTTGGILLVSRWTEGLGSVTHLSDTFPWGLWKFNVLYGVALGAGGFVTAGLVYVFRIRVFYPILRTAVLIAYLGYTLLGLVSLLIDIGRPLNFWSPFVNWQHYSVLFEVFWCISLYTIVLTVEFSPILLERLGWNRVARSIHLITIPSVMAGVILSTLHQSSLGSLFLIVPEKILPLWYSPLLPLFFFISAIAGGMAMIVVVSLLCLRLLGKGPRPSVLVSLSRVISPLLIIFLFLRVIDLTVHNAWVYIFSYPFQGLTFVIEMAFFVLPVYILLYPRNRESQRALFFASACVVLGVILNRLNVAWFSLIPASSYVYIPSWKEMVITLNLVSYGVCIFSLAARHLQLFEHPRESRREVKYQETPALAR